MLAGRDVSDMLQSAAVAGDMSMLVDTGAEENTANVFGGIGDASKRMTCLFVGIGFGAVDGKAVADGMRKYLGRSSLDLDSRR